MQSKKKAGKKKSSEKRTKRDFALTFTGLRGIDLQMLVKFWSLSKVCSLKCNTSRIIFTDKSIKKDSTKCKSREFLFHDATCQRGYNIKRGHSFWISGWKVSALSCPPPHSKWTFPFSKPRIDSRKLDARKLSRTWTNVDQLKSNDRFSFARIRLVNKFLSCPSKARRAVTSELMNISDHFCSYSRNCSILKRNVTLYVRS